MSDITNDVIIVGGGPAGLTAAIYTSRDGLDTLLLEQAVCGGLAGTTDLIENYPGFPDGINGMELIAKFKQQALRFGTNIVEFKEVKGIEPTRNRIKVQTAQGEHNALAVIIASGSTPRTLGIPGEEEYTGRGVSYCATCDGYSYRDRKVLVAGGGDAAVKEAMFLTKLASKVYIVHRRDTLGADRIVQDRARSSDKIQFVWDTVVTGVMGDDAVTGVRLKNVRTGEESTLQADGVFIYVGVLPNSKFLEGVVELDDSGHIVTNEEMETSVPGIYAVGDVRSKKVRQISVACGEATIAAISARDYIKELT